MAGPVGVGVVAAGAGSGGSSRVGGAGYRSTAGRQLLVLLEFEHAEKRWWVSSQPQHGQEAGAGTAG
jgi:hypothetical protein